MVLDSPIEPRGDDRGQTERRLRRLTFGFIVIAAAAGAAQAWFARFAMNPDGIQYLDNATAWVTGDWHNALNSLWSPLYPWLIAGMFRIARPSPFQEFPLVHLLNFLIYLLSLAAFLFFLSCVARRVERGSHQMYVLLFACSSFLYCSLDLATLSYVTPDALVSLFAFLTAGLLLRLTGDGAGWSHALALGIVLGLGYLAKSPFLIFALAALLIAGVLRRRRLSRIVLTVLAFVAIAGPYVWALSKTKGRFTFGDSGKLNVLWHVDGIPFYNWQGGPVDVGVPAHATHQLSLDPNLYEFAGPIYGTYPPWYDPSYWYEGARVPFRPTEIARVIWRGLGVYAYLVHHRQLALLFAALVLFVLAGARRALAEISKFWPVLLFGALPFAMYALIHAEGRYLAPFFVLLWTGLFAGVLNALPDSAGRRAVLAISVVTALLMVVEAVTALRPEKPIGPHYAVAQSLQELGLKPGDRVAIVSGDLDYYWARLDQARITMQIDFSDSLCRSCTRLSEQWGRVKQLVGTSGVTFVVAPCLPGVVDQPGWRKLDDTGTFAYRVR